MVGRLTVRGVVSAAAAVNICGGRCRSASGSMPSATRSRTTVSVCADRDHPRMQRADRVVVEAPAHFQAPSRWVLSVEEHLG
jgi:hypothetical protein